MQRQSEGLNNTLLRLAEGATSRRKMLQTQLARASQLHTDDVAAQLGAGAASRGASDWAARDIRMLIQWLSHDVLALARPALTTRQMLYDFIVEELTKREPEDARRIRPCASYCRNSGCGRLCATLGFANHAV